MSRKIKGKVVRDTQYDVYSVLKKYGPLPDHALVPLAQHVSPTHQSSSGIRTRRAELVELGLAAPTGNVVKTASNRDAVIYQAIR